MRVAKLVSLLGLLSAPVASAHALETGTTRVTLRDDEVELLAHWDLFLLLPSTPTEVAVAPAGALAGIHARLLGEVVAGTLLSADGVPVPLRWADPITPEELRALAATLSSTDRLNGELVRLRFESQRPVTGARQLRLSVPAALGPTLATFVQPASAYVPPAGIATFEVLSSGPRRHEGTSAVGAFTGLAVAALVHATVVIARFLARRRGRPA